MSLDITFYKRSEETGCYRRDGEPILVEEMLKAFPDYLPEKKEVWWRNITHNVGKIAALVPIKDGIKPDDNIPGTSLYQIMWRPTAEMFGKKEWPEVQPSDYINYIGHAIKYMESHLTELSKYNAANGWGTAVGLLEYIRDMYQACKNNSDVDEINISI